MKKFVLFIVFIVCMFCLLWTSGAPEMQAYSSNPIRFRGNIDYFSEKEVVGAPGEPTYWIVTLKATVETDSGDIYELKYTDWEPPANTPSDWRQFLIFPDNSWWNFAGVDNGAVNHKFEALGQINVPAWWVIHHDKRSEDNNGLLLGRMTGVFDITEGEWEGHNIVGGRANFNFTFEKDEYWAKGGCQDVPCTETVSGTIKGQIIVEE